MKINPLFHKLLLAPLAISFLFPAPASVPAHPQEAKLAAHTTAPALQPDENPDVMDTDFVNDFTISGQVIYWHMAPAQCPAAAQTGGSPQAGAVNSPQSDAQSPGTAGAGIVELEKQPDVKAPDPYVEQIGRTPIYGGETRVLYQRNTSCGVSDILSNMVADGDYIYWISYTQGGLVRLTRNANSTDAAQFMAGGEISGRGYLTQYLDKLYFVNYTNGNLYSIDKATFEKATAVPGACVNSCGKAIVTSAYYYVISGAGSLLRYKTGTLEKTVIEDNLVKDFAANEDYIFYAKGNAVLLRDNNSLLNYDFYRSPIAFASVYNLIWSGSYVFLFEMRNACSGQNFPCYNYRLIRIPINAPETIDELILYPEDRIAVWQDWDQLAAAGDFVFYRGNPTWNLTPPGDARVYRLPQNSAALPKQNMQITGMEFTQAIQTVDNQVGLVEGKRTFVRVYVQSESTPIPGVTAYLYKTNAAGEVIFGPLKPVNSIGQRLTVLPAPNRADLNQSFLFELPWTWIFGTNNYYKAVLNPTQVPLEPNYNDNVWPNTNPLPAVNFRRSPRLETLFVSFGYILNNTSYYPSLPRDIIPTYSFITRSYPLSSAWGLANDPTPGFRPNWWTVLDDNLGTRVNRTDPSCAAAGNLCASAYTNMLLATMRTNEGVAADIFMYGMISDRAGFFPRGQEAGGGNRVSSGPVGNPASPAEMGAVSPYAWDTDSTYGDWYAAHEIGHSLGRAHPTPGSAACGHSASDPSYPYPNAEISPAGGAFAGFDAGDKDPKVDTRFLAGNANHDIMSYCNNQWVSDYTYRGIYQSMMGAPLTTAPQPANLAPQPAPEPRIPGTIFVNRPKLAGDFLSVAGFIMPSTSTASLQIVRHLSAVSTIPDITPGEYAIRQVGSGGAALQDDAFTPAAVEDASQMLTFNQTVDYAPGAAEVQIVRVSDSTVLASYPLSANPPSVSDVNLANPTGPVTGTVTLNWNATDPDGDTLSFNLLYSSNGGQTFIPLLNNVPGPSAQVDTGRLAGSDAAVFRVTASDGANEASADSAQFAMAPKPPQVRITLPEDGQHIQYGTWFNLEAAADDPQDGSEVSYSWATQVSTFASGRQVTIGSIGTGPQTITVTVTNSKGLSASDSITVYIDDDLNIPGPTLSAGPKDLVFQTEAGSTTPQSAQVSIANVGSGSLDWTASADAAWLSLDLTSGSVPATLTVAANPSGLKANATYTATVTISSSAAGSPITIPVALSIGDVWNPPVNGKQLFLPVIAVGR